MPTTKNKLKSKQQPVSTAQNVNGPSGEVMTLSEVAAFLRLDDDEVVRLVREQGLPGRLAGTEWRFLQSSIRQWLNTPMPQPSKEAQLAVAGAWKDDPMVDEELRAIYQRRGRPMTEDEP